MLTKPLRIMAFAGSTRRESFNNQLVRIAESGARDAGGSVTHIDLRDYRLPIFDQDEEAANGKPDNARTLKQLMRDHEGLLIASPEYNSSVTAVLKNTIDWVSRSDDGDPFPLVALRGKVVVLMSASPGALGGLRGLVHLRSILATLGCIVLPDQVTVSKAHEAFTVDGVLIDDRQHQRILALGKTLAETGAKLRGD
jgi:chromate reductase